jgi:hypothetical protein
MLTYTLTYADALVDVDASSDIIRAEAATAKQVSFLFFFFFFFVFHTPPLTSSALRLQRPNRCLFSFSPFFPLFFTRLL